MANKQSLSTDKQIRRLLEFLGSPEAETRLTALRAISELPYIDRPLANKLENVAANDRNQACRKEALNILHSSLYREFFLRAGAPSKRERQIVLGQLQAWQDEELLPPDLAAVLAARYGFDQIPAVAIEPEKEAPAPKPKPRRKETKSRSLGEVLLSQGSINIALYLGSFLILAAALYYTAFSDSLRIPILAFATALFAAGAFGLKRRQPSASMVLFSIYALLVPILGTVVLSAVPALQGVRTAFWIGVNFFLLANWIYAARQYSARLFALLAFASFNLLPFQFRNLFDLGFEYALLLAGLTNLLSMVVLRRLLLAQLPKKTKRDAIDAAVSAAPGRQFAFLFPLSHIWQIVLFFGLLAQLVNIEDQPVASQLAVFFTCLVAVAYYLVAQSIKSFRRYAYMAAVYLWLAAWPLVILLTDRADVTNVYFLVTAALFAVFGHWLTDNQTMGMYAKPLLLGSWGFFGVAHLIALFGYPDQAPYFVWVFLSSLTTCIVYFVLTLRKVTDFVWGSALAALLFAYLAFYELPFMQSVSVYIGYKLLLLPLFYLSAEWVAGRLWPHISVIRAWLAIFGLITSALLAILIMPRPYTPLADSALCWLVIAAFWLLYSYLSKYLVYFYAAVVSFFIAMTSFLRVAEFAYVAYAQMGLAYVYYLIGSLRIVEAWRRPARLCGLVAAGLLGLTGEVFADQQTAAALSLLAVVLFLIAHSREYRSNPGGPLANPVLALRLSSVALTLIGMYQADALGEPVLTAAYFAAYGLSFAGFAAYNKIPGFVYLANFAFAAAVVYIQQALAFTDAFLGFFLLALAFTAISYLPALRKSPQNWSPVFRRSGLALGAVIAVSAPAFSGPLIAVVLAAVATLFALEAWQARKVWLAVAADLLYIEAYFFVLFALNINEQQFFTTGAAALGLALHYLLRKMDAPRTTFVAGLLSQFVLLGSSYIQMVQTENLSFFLVLFFQGLAVIVYGTVIRSRSLVLVPIGFIVLGIASIVVKAFSDFLSLIAIGCSGLLLLGLGIWALFLRERIDKAGERVRASFADWSP